MDNRANLLTPATPDNAGGSALPERQPVATNRAEWPSGSVLACALASYEFGPAIVYCRIAEAGRNGASYRA